MRLSGIAVLSLSILMLAGCQTTPKAKPAPVIGGMPNPASAFCVEQHGKLEVRSTPEGAIGYCHLPDGVVVEEWTYFREHSPAAKGN